MKDYSDRRPGPVRWVEPGPSLETVRHLVGDLACGGLTPNAVTGCETWSRQAATGQSADDAAHSREERQFTQPLRH